MVVLSEVDRLLASRTRDIRLQGELLERFRERTWPLSSKAVQAWMAWMASLSLVTLSLSMVTLDPSDWRPMVVPTMTIPPVAIALLLFCHKRRSHALTGAVLICGMFLILLATCFIGINAGGEFYDRHLHVMLFVALTAIVIFPVPLAWTGTIAGIALGLYLFFQIQNPNITTASALAGIAYFVCGFAASIAARRATTLLAQKQFLLMLRREADLTDLASANERLTHLARNDPLTGVANRRQMSDALDLCWSSREGMVGTAILMCDIDDFKKLNDRLGHAAGDRCLVEVARIIGDQVRRDGSQVARYGGEEFLVLLPRVGEHVAGLVAERIRKGVEAAQLPNPDSSIGPYVTVSVGVAIVPDDGVQLQPEQLQKMADVALYAAKHAGRNQVAVYQPEAET